MEPGSLIRVTCGLLGDQSLPSLLLVTRYSLLTTYYLLLITYYSTESFPSFFGSGEPGLAVVVGCCGGLMLCRFLWGDFRLCRLILRRRYGDVGADCRGDFLTVFRFGLLGFIVKC